MARATMNPQAIVRTGLSPSYGAVDQANGNQFANDGISYLHVFNGSAGSITVTVITPGLVDGLAVADRPVTVPAGENRKIGPFPPGIYNQSDGMVYVDWSDGTSVTAGVFRL